MCSEGEATCVKAGVGLHRSPVYSICFQNGRYLKWKEFCFLNLRSRRWSRHSNYAADGICSSIDSPHVDMDGGLVVGPNYEQSWRTWPASTLVVRNLTAPNTRKELPSAPNHWTFSSLCCHFCLLNLGVKDNTQTFKVFLINGEFEKLEDPDITLVERRRILDDPMLRVYNSATSEWKGLTNPSCIFENVRGQSNFQLIPTSMVMLQDCPHILFTSGFDGYDVFNAPRFEPQLWRYNLHEDLWENMHCRPSHYGKLIVSVNRLFLVGWSLVGARKQFNVTEIEVPDKTCVSLFTWTEAQVADVFDIQGDLSNLWRYNRAHAFDNCLINIHVTGFDNSLMFTSFVTPGKLISFDFVNNKFDRKWPPLNPLKDLPDEIEDIRFAYGDFCAWKQMNLLLPGTPF